MNNNDWIPVSSGLLPDEGEVVQVTYLGYYDHKPYCDEFAYVYEGKWYWCHEDENNNCEVKVEITAWKHNCEPYEGTSKGDDMYKDYRFLEPKEVINELRSLPFGSSVDFTFDTPEDESANFEPSGWYGVKFAKLFDENIGVLCFGMYGGMYTKAESISETSEIYDLFQQFLDSEAGYSVDMLCVSNKYNGN